MRVYISTNCNQPANCFRALKEKACLNVLVAALANNLKVEAIKDVFLISDTIDNIEIDNKTDCCLLFHTKTKKNILETFDYKKQGQHEQGRDGLYAPVFSILLDSTKNEQEKLSEIIKTLGFTKDKIEEKDTLEAKLEFLHLCLTPDELSKAEYKKEWEVENDMNTLKVTNDGHFGENYVKTLCVIRNKLLD